MDDSNESELSNAELATSKVNRNKPQTLNIDSALFLQSQALDVQQPSIHNTKFQAKARATRLSPALTTTDKNISVDYIDCVSNNDLSAANARLQQANNSPLVIRKHLRFGQNVSNKVAPLTTNETTTTIKNTFINRNSSSTSSTGSNISENNNNEINNNNNNNNTGIIIDSRRLPQNNCLLQQPHININTLNSNIKQQQQQINDVDTNNCLLSSQQATAATSVLYPILVSDVKRRTYFIGSTPQDSLVGHDELYRYFPSGKVSIFVCTWNQNRKRAPPNINDLLLPDQLTLMPDIYAVGVQEAFSSQSEYLHDWEVQLQANLGSSHVLLHSASLGVLHLSLFVRRDLIWFCSTPEESLYNSRAPPTNMIKTKGAVSIAFRFFGTSLMFINCHFPAHENRLQNRIDEYVKIINSIDLPKNLKLLKPRYLSNDSTARFDCVFFMGDLNFRLKQRSFDETVALLEQIFQQKEPNYESLTQHDELLSTLEAGLAFKGFDESIIKFPPTYKFLAQTNKYDRQSNRVPSYTDRILFRSKRQGHIQCLIYDWLPNLISSDHKPVYCLFNALIRPCADQSLIPTLNAGLFQRTVYLDALKRRAKVSNARLENEVDSNICSLI